MPADSRKDIPEQPSPQGEGQTPSRAEESVSPPDTSAEVQKLREEKKHLTDQLLRKQAELENFRKRTEREKQDFMQYSLFDAVKSLLPVLDGFELALQADGGGEDYRKGMSLIYQQLSAALQKLGLQKVEAQGAHFDPRFHEAVATIETNDIPDHQIVEELQRGYLFKDRLLRPAMVKVAKHQSGNNRKEKSQSE